MKSMLAVCLLLALATGALSGLYDGYGLGYGLGYGIGYGGYGLGVVPPLGYGYDLAIASPYFVRPYYGNYGGFYRPYGRIGYEPGYGYGYRRGYGHGYGYGNHHRHRW